MINFLHWEHEPSSFDLVLCLSVTKWVHLCYGDQGIEDLFKIFSEILRPGGILVLEYQERNSYKLSSKKEELQRMKMKDQKEFRYLARLVVSLFFFFLTPLLLLLFLLRIQPGDFEGLLTTNHGFLFLDECKESATTFKNRPMKIFKRLPK